MRPGWQATHTVSLSSARKWAGASFGKHGTWVLDAPDILLSGAATADNLRDSVSRHAREGRRVLLLAHSDLPLADDALPQALTPVALSYLHGTLDQARTAATVTLCALPFGSSRSLLDR